jgi:lipoyl(octanoyl) transferase
MSPLDYQWLGRIEYTDCLELQNELVAKRHAGEIGDTVLFLEHEPVYTIGRTRDRSSLRQTEEMLPHPVVEINRGGQATYHGPGQLVGYLILDLHRYGQDLHTYLRAVEEVLIQFLQSQNLDAGRREGLTGVWMENRKIASIGIGVKKWISMHGFGFNVTRDLSGYDSIIPCGISDVRMTSLAEEANKDNWTPQSVSELLIPFIDAELASLGKKS